MKKFLVQIEEPPTTQFKVSDHEIKMELLKRAQLLAVAGSRGALPIVSVLQEERRPSTARMRS